MSSGLPSSLTRTVSLNFIDVDKLRDANCMGTHANLSKFLNNIFYRDAGLYKHRETSEHRFIRKCATYVT